MPKSISNLLKLLMDSEMLENKTKSYEKTEFTRGEWIFPSALGYE